MDIKNLEQDSQALSDALSHIQTISINKKSFFIDHDSGKCQVKELENFERVKAWKPIASLKKTQNNHHHNYFVLHNRETKELSMLVHKDNKGEHSVSIKSINSVVELNKINIEMFP